VAYRGGPRGVQRGAGPRVSQAENYNSHNTVRLTVAIKEKLLGLEEVTRELAIA